jgi:hypothetical protein
MSSCRNVNGFAAPGVVKSSALKMSLPHAAFGSSGKFKFQGENALGVSRED